MNIFTPATLKSLMFSILLLLTLHGYTQNDTDGCGTITTSESLEYLNSFKSQIEKYELEFNSLISKSSKSSQSKDATSSVINSIPIKAHILRNSDGTGGLSISELNSAIDNLNSIYTGAFMEFFLCDGINYISNDTFYNHFEKSEESVVTRGNNVEGVINIYFTKYVEISDGNSLCGYANTFGGPDVIVMNNDCATNGSSLAHEVGHFFSLIHTHGPSNSNLTTELIDGSNCDTDGDGICDTPADPQLSTSNVNSSCVYTGTATDDNGDSFNPDTENIMSYSRSSCKSHFSPQQLARLYAFYKSARHYLSCPTFNVDFTVDYDQECGNFLTVNFSDRSDGATYWEWDVDGDGAVDYTTQNPTHTYSEGVYDVTLIVSKGFVGGKNASNTNKETIEHPETTISKTFYQFIKVGTIEDASLQVDFEDFDMASSNGWTATDVTGNGYNWYANSGDTVTSGTGPAVDNTHQASFGTYIYAEASGANPGDVADYVSPCIQVNSLNAEFGFNYHMYGNNVGELHVDIETSTGEYDTDVIPVISGQKQTSQMDAYLNQAIDLSSYANKTINIHLRAVRGASWDGDIAIDDMVITGDLQLPVNSNFTSENKQIKIYPNPVSGETLYVQTEQSNEPLKYEVVNLIGQVFLSGNLTNDQINVNNLSPGTYFLTLGNSKSRSIKKFIK
jgi:hypothetical protein